MSSEANYLERFQCNYLMPGNMHHFFTFIFPFYLFVLHHVDHVGKLFRVVLFLIINL